MTSIHIRAAADQRIVEIEEHDLLSSYRGRDEESLRLHLAAAAEAAYAALYPARPRLTCRFTEPGEAGSAA